MALYDALSLCYGPLVFHHSYSVLFCNMNMYSYFHTLILLSLLWWSSLALCYLQESSMHMYTLTCSDVYSRATDDGA